jgi:hypothetical protein
MVPTLDQRAFAADMTTLGTPRGIVFLGHMGTEDRPMTLVAEWLRGFVPDLPIAFLPAGEPFHPPLNGSVDTAPPRHRA